MNPIIKCEHTDFGYENHDAVIDLNLEIYPGDYLCVVGAVSYTHLKEEQNYLHPALCRCRKGSIIPLPLRAAGTTFEKPGSARVFTQLWL